MADSNPHNFANLPKDELREIAAKGGQASHGPSHKAAEVHHILFPYSSSTDSFVQTHPDRNPDGTFTKGSELAKELGSVGGHVAHEHQIEKDGVSSLDTLPS